MARCPACNGEYDATFCPRDGARLVQDTVRIVADRYRLQHKVGEGAMGEVYEAEHVHLHRKVAVKLLQRRIASEPDVMQRFQREAQSTTGLGHPNIVDTIDFGFAADGQPFLVMEWLEGENLDQRLSRGRIDLATAIEIARQACLGLAAAHERGVVHRDLKPANLFLTRDHRGALLVKVLDFGIAKLRLHETKLTATGVLIGTPNYMAPEQAEGTTVDARTDIYALGIILYEMLTGVVPFSGDTPLAVLHQHTSRMPVPPSVRAPGRGIGDGLDMIVMRCLAKQREQRFPSMHELGEALASVQDAPARPTTHADPEKPRALPPPTLAAASDEIVLPQQRRWPIVALVGGLLAIAGLIVYLARGHAPPAATHEDAAVVARVPVDAAPVAIDAPAVDAALRSISYELHGQRFTGTITVRPAPPIEGQTVEIVVAVTTLEPWLVDAAKAGRLSATLELRYFKDHSLVDESTHALGTTQEFTASVRLAHAAKHHAHVDLLVDGKEVDHAKVDLFPELR